MHGGGFGRIIVGVRHGTTRLSTAERQQPEAIWCLSTTRVCSCPVAGTSSCDSPIQQSAAPTLPTTRMLDRVPGVSPVVLRVSSRSMHPAISGDEQLTL